MPKANNVITMIAKRGAALTEIPAQTMRRAITKAHARSPLKLRELLNADELSFCHDITGILKHLDYKTGELKYCFLPRFAKR